MAKKQKLSFRQRFKAATPAQKAWLILKFLGIFSVLYLFKTDKPRKEVHATVLGDHVTYDEETGEVLYVQRTPNNFFKNVNH